MDTIRTALAALLAAACILGAPTARADDAVRLLCTHITKAGGMVMEVGFLLDVTNFGYVTYSIPSFGEGEPKLAREVVAATFSPKSIKFTLARGDTFEVRRGTGNFVHETGRETFYGSCSTSSSKKF